MNTGRVLVGIPEGKKPQGRPRHRWKCYVIMDLEGIGWGCMDWIRLSEDRDKWRDLVNTVMSLRLTQNVGKFLSG
jgi:hypothetical protein